MSANRVAKSLDYEQVRQGATVRAFREIRGLKVAELANLVGISYAYLSNIEAGRKRLTPQLLSRIATALDIRQVALVHPDSFPESERVA